jgi:hypothetical protein
MRYDEGSSVGDIMSHVVKSIISAGVIVAIIAVIWRYEDSRQRAKKVAEIDAAWASRLMDAKQFLTISLPDAAQVTRVISLAEPAHVALRKIIIANRAERETWPPPSEAFYREHLFKTMAQLAKKSSNTRDAMKLEELASLATIGQPTGNEDLKEIQDELRKMEVPTSTEATTKPAAP